MPLGDSITFEDYVGDIRPDGVRTSYRDDLWYSLTDAGYDVDFVGSLIAGEDIVPQFDPDNEGHPGFRANQIRDEVFDWLQLNPADIILLHIGTNDISDPQTVAEIVLEVEEILDWIFAYSPEITVILAKIINRKSFSQKTNDFNNLLPGMVNTHPNKDKVIIVDMEVGAGIDYDTDMIDTLHPDPDGNGYAKMANVWFSALEEILPAADAGSNQNVNEDETVTLDGSNSNDPELNPILSYLWEQTEGTDVTLLPNPTIVKPTFTAPGVGSQGETLSFRLTVTHSNGSTSTDTTNVKVNGIPDDPPNDSSSSGGGGCFISTATNGSYLEPHVTMYR